MSDTLRKIAPVFATVVLALGLCWSAAASAQDSDSDDEQTEGEQAESAEDQQDQASSLRRGNRMEFDARLIRGESAGSGAVFLFERGQRPLPSMINKRKSFLRDTVGSVLGSEWAEKFEEAQNSDD